MAPAISREYYLREKGGRIPLDLSSCVVPSAATRRLLALRNYGTKRFADVVENAIRVADGGVPVHHFMARSIRGFLDGYRRIR